MQGTFWRDVLVPLSKPPLIQTGQPLHVSPMCSCMLMLHVVCVHSEKKKHTLLWELLTRQAAGLFLGGLLLPSGGPHWRVLALCVSPLRLRESSQAQPRTAHGQQPTALHYTQMARLLMQCSMTFSLVFSKWIREIPPPLKTDTQKQPSGPVSVLSVPHKAPLDNTTVSI